MNIQLNRYDVVVWRVVGSLLLIFVFCAVIGLAVAGGTLIRSGGEKPRAEMGEANGAPKAQALHLGYFDRMAGTDTILVPLVAESSARIGSLYSSSSGQDAKNYLLFNTKTKTARWLWKGTSVSVTEVQLVFDRGSHEEGKKVVGLLVVKPERDTNGDGRVNQDDLQNVDYFPLNSVKSFRVAAGVDRVIGMEQSRSNQVLLFFAKEHKSSFMELLLEPQSVSAAHDIGSPD
jgi:hypothetical protein